MKSVSAYFDCSQSLHEVLQPNKHQEWGEIPRQNRVLGRLVLTQVGPSVLVCVAEVRQHIYSRLHSLEALLHVSFQDVFWVQETPGLTSK